MRLFVAWNSRAAGSIAASRVANWQLFVNRNKSVYIATPSPVACSLMTRNPIYAFIGRKNPNLHDTPDLQNHSFCCENHRFPARKRNRSPDFPQKASVSIRQDDSRGTVISIVHLGWCPVTVLSDLLPVRYASQAASARPPHLITGFAPFTIVARSGCASRSDASDQSSG